MNIVFSMLSEAAEQGVIERLQSLGDASQQLADKDYWGSVGIIALTGILVVFLILAILIFFFWLMGTIFKAHDAKKAAKNAASVKKEVYTPAPKAAEPVSQMTEEAEDDAEIVAVISAAIAAFEGEGKSFSIKNISRHKDNRVRSAWSMAGIRDNMNRQ